MIGTPQTGATIIPKDIFDGSLHLEDVESKVPYNLNQFDPLSHAEDALSIHDVLAQELRKNWMMASFYARVWNFVYQGCIN